MGSDNDSEDDTSSSDERMVVATLTYQASADDPEEMDSSPVNNPGGTTVSLVEDIRAGPSNESTMAQPNDLNGEHGIDPVANNKVTRDESFLGDPKGTTFDFGKSLDDTFSFSTGGAVSSLRRPHDSDGVGDNGVRESVSLAMLKTLGILLI